MAKLAREIKRLVIHCSDSPDDRDSVDMEEINRWHTERGFKGPTVDGKPINCGYHYVIKRDGVVEAGRPEGYRGAHCRGHNIDSLGIVWVGRDQLSPEQKLSLLLLIKMLLIRHGLKAEAVFGHCELDRNKTCPNLDMEAFRAEVKSA